MSKYYKVIKENFIWEVGAIITNENDSSGYEPVEEIYNVHPDAVDEYISSSVVENSPEYFQRVYKVDLVTRTVYEVKEKAKELLSRSFQE